MEDDASDFKRNEAKPVNPEPASSFSSMESTSKHTSNALSPVENKNAQPITETMDSFVTNNKVNGDCSVECSVPSPSLPSTSDTKIISESKMSMETTIEEKSSNEDADEDNNSESKEETKEEEPAETDSITKDVDQSENLTCLSPEKSDSSHQKNENISNENESAVSCLENADDSIACEKSLNTSNENERGSTSEEKNILDSNDDIITSSAQIENKPTVSRTRKSSSDSNASVVSNKNSDTFKTPPKLDQKSSTSKLKTNDDVNESNQKQNEGANKATKNNKRKLDEKQLNISDKMETHDVEKFPIQYKGFKKKVTCVHEKNEKRLNIRWNPFNPAYKPDGKSNKSVTSKFPAGDEIDCSGLQQSEYAQYLGLQPILKFRCSNCGSSAFQSMVALNTHKIECTKTGKGKIDITPPCLSNTLNEPKSTNIKLTRKVFLCSACGTYYEHWNLFLHMREVHRRYICLYCLGMFSIAEKLSEHLIQKHKIINQNFNNLEDFQKHCYQAFYLVCLTCDKVFSEMDDFYAHVCNANKKSIDSGDTSSKSEATASQDCNALTNSETCTNVSSSKTSTKRPKETNKKSTVVTRSASSQMRKEEAKKEESGNTIRKTESINIPANDKEDIKSTDVDENKISESVEASSNETKALEQKEIASIEADALNKVDQEMKPQESQIHVENPPSVEKSKPIRKSRTFPRRVAGKRKKLKEQEETNESTAPKIKKVTECGEPLKESEDKKDTVDENTPASTMPNEETEDCTDIREELNSVQDISPNQVEESKSDMAEEHKEETVHVPEPDKPDVIQEEDDQQEQFNASKEELTSVPVNSTSNTDVESKNKLQANLLKFKLPGIESDAESDDSQKLSLVVDETAKSDSEDKISAKSCVNSPGDNTTTEVKDLKIVKTSDGNNCKTNDTAMPDITLASEDVTVMALTLDDKLENIPIQTILKECVRTSCMSCNYCRHAVKIAVNGKQLALHILSEHRYMPIKNETPDDVINKLKTSLNTIEKIFFNTETYDSSDLSIHVPYDQDSSFDCFQCNYVTTTHRDLFAHKRKSHTKSLLLCIMCKSNFYSYSELLCHLCPGTYNAEVQFHNVDINFRCCFCRLDTIPSAFRLMVHLRKTHHACDICLENGVDQQKLSTHMWKHKLNHLCYRCGIAYASKPDITKHLFWKHGHESVLCKKCLQKKWPHVYHFCIPPTSFICEECNTSFSKAVALKVHKRIHVNDFPYTCSECSKKFVSKKLLQRHEERHVAIKNNVEQKQNEIHEDDEEQKDEIINVSDVVNENKESSVADLSDSKETELKDKSHKKHKKDKEKKSKQVVDVYDLPPLNLSSESDSSDEDNHAAENSSKIEEKKEDLGITDKEEAKEEKINSLENIKLNDNADLSQNEEESEKKDGNNVDCISSSDLVNKSPIKEDNTTSPSMELSEKDGDVAKHQENTENSTAEMKVNEADEVKVENDSDVIKETAENETLENIPSNDETINNKEVEDIWKNFYSTNPQNSNLPYPLCAIKTEIALGIIMGDHDYCHQPIIEPPVFREEIPSTNHGLSVPMITDQLEESTEHSQDKPSDIAALVKETTNVSSPVSSPKKKPKSPKKKNSKGGENDNSSSSSDSSSESTSSSCSCGPNCSCSSSSSNSSSSSSSDSDSSAAEDGNKQERKRKKRERRSKTKSDHEPEQPPKEPEVQEPEVEKTISLEPVDPPIRESELETDETTTDEEFYDQQPQRIANQLLAEKRNQLMLLASAANANNGNTSPSPIVDVMPQEIISPPKQKVRTKRKRKITTKGKANSEKSVMNSHQYPLYQKDDESLTPKPIPPYLSNPLPPAEQKLSLFVTTPTMAETPGSGSETEKSRSSKRRRIPNKFYGYSSGDEDEKPAPSPKWRKQDTVPQTPRIQPAPVHPPTPRIQLTVPKQVIRKPYKFQKTQPPKVQASSSDSTDSGSEIETPRVTHAPPLPLPQQPPPPPPPAPPVSQDTSVASATATSQKNEKDVYCYCRCPYDEVSEMIACDDENCEIEWFHFECVGILVPPRGQWFCPGCRKARGLPT